MFKSVAQLSQNHVSDDAVTKISTSSVEKNLLRVKFCTCVLLDAVKQSMMKMMIGTRFIIRESQESMESPVKETHFIRYFCYIRILASLWMRKLF